MNLKSKIETRDQLFDDNLEEKLQSFSLQQNIVPSDVEPLSHDEEHPFSTFLLL